MVLKNAVMFSVAAVAALAGLNPSPVSGGASAEAPLFAKPFGDWTALRQADGVLQWAYRGRAVYLFHNDGQPGDDCGARHAGWQVARP